MEHPHGQPEGGVAVTAVHLGQRLLPEAGDGDHQSRIARVTQVVLHAGPSLPVRVHRDRPVLQGTEPAAGLDDSLERATSQGDGRELAHSRLESHLGREPQPGPGPLRCAEDMPDVSQAVARNHDRVEGLARVSGRDRLRHLEDGVGLAARDVVSAAEPLPAPSSASTFARATSVTCTKSRSCPPSSKTRRRPARKPTRSGRCSPRPRRACRGASAARRRCGTGARRPRRRARARRPRRGVPGAAWSRRRRCADRARTPRSPRPAAAHGCSRGMPAPIVVPRDRRGCAATDAPIRGARSGTRPRRTRPCCSRRRSDRGSLGRAAR